MFCDENGIHKELTTPYTPEQNGVAEQKNRIVVEIARSLLKAKDLPNYFWREAVATTVYLLNISPTKVVWNTTTLEAWNDKKSRDAWMIESTFESCFTVGSRVVTWSSKKQETIALLTSEAEYTITTLAV